MIGDGTVSQAHPGLPKAVRDRGLQDSRGEHPVSHSRGPDLHLPLPPPCPGLQGSPGPALLCHCPLAEGLWERGAGSCSQGRLSVGARCLSGARSRQDQVRAPGDCALSHSFPPPGSWPSRPSGGWEQEQPPFPGPEKGRGCGWPARVSPSPRLRLPAGGEAWAGGQGSWGRQFGGSRPDRSAARRSLAPRQPLERPHSVRGALQSPACFQSLQ